MCLPKGEHEVRPYKNHCGGVLGRHIVHFNGTAKDRQKLKNRLKTAGCKVDDTGDHWLEAGNFETALEIGKALSPQQQTLGLSEVERHSFAQADPWANIEEKYPEGKLIQGKVTKLVEFGAFVELEQGVEALLHISEMSWEKVGKPGDVVKENQEITAKVIKSDAGKRKIRLSLRELQEDPWHKFLEQYVVGSAVEGPITEIKDFGAFMKITDDVEGLIHVSEITDERIATPRDVLQSGQTVKARLIGINEEKRQVRLSMRTVQTQERLVRAEDSGHEEITLGEHVKGLKELKELLGI